MGEDSKPKNNGDRDNKKDDACKNNNGNDFYVLHDSDVLKLTSYELIELKRVKFEIRVFGLVNFGPIVYKVPTIHNLKICNNGKTSPILTGIRMANSNCQFEVIMDANDNSKRKKLEHGITLKPNNEYNFSVKCKSIYLGQDHRIMIISFNGFEYGIELEVNVVDIERYNLIKPISEFKQTDYMFRDRMDQYIRAPYPPRKKNYSVYRPKIRRVLSERPVNEVVKQCLVKNENELDLSPTLEQKLTMHNFVDKMNILIDMEDIASQIDLSCFNRDCEVFTRFNDTTLIMHAEGLGEFRPSLIEGDCFLVKQSSYQDRTSIPAYEAVITLVEENQIHFMVSYEVLANYKNVQYNVNFLHNRISSKREITAVNSTLKTDVMFPTKVSLCAPYIQAPKAFYSRKLNDIQKAAVIAMVEGRARPTPYILFGPPGTGKTNTIIEAVEQIRYLKRDSRILLCAGTNCAVDVLVQRLHETGRYNTASVFRLKPVSRPMEKIEPVVRAYCHDDGTSYDKPIIVTTVSSALAFYEQCSKPFTHIFIDEAGQLKESETVIPMMFLNCNSSQLVLAGDPKQLGPVVISDLAFKYGFANSLLERLCNLPIYARNTKLYADTGNYNRYVITKLVNNYRSHGHLLTLPSRMFYNSELTRHADPSTTDQFLSWSKLRNKEVPLIFHGVRGDENREGNSPSYFNQVEALQVVDYYQSLHQEFPHIPAKQFGIMSPYKKQAEKIKKLIQAAGLPEIDVSSVEKFQGQERSVIILTTVRSNENNVESDLKYRIGFLRNPKRFNVGITRSKSLLIIVGNPHLLVFDDYWQDMIQYSLNHKCYIGCNLPPCFDWNKEKKVDRGQGDMDKLCTKLQTCKLPK